MAYLRHIIFVVAVAVLLVHVFGAATISKRSESTSSSESPPEICSGRTPCGWAIYNRTTRFIDYFMKNRCICDGEKAKKCLRDDDDISIAAYVYRCKIEEDDRANKTTKVRTQPFVSAIYH